MKKRIIVSVSNDLYSDQRVRKVCESLHKLGFDIILLGRLLSDSKEITDRPYKIKRFKLPFNNGPLFYASLNIRIFVYLIFHKTDVLLANDLDTLLPNFIISKLKTKALVYDTHELFTEVPELKDRYSKKVWKRIEKWIFPKLKYVFTVNKSIADIYESKYGVKINVIKNIPNRLDSFTPQSKAELRIENIGKYIILQGAGINIDRGAEELVESMKYVNGVSLLIVGSGDVLPKLKAMVKEMNLSDKVVFIKKQSPHRLRSFTYHAELGLSLDKNTNLNYRYSLPNKIFDYLQAGIPILASNLIEIKKVVVENNVGVICKSHDINEISSCINKMITDNAKEKMSEDIKKAASVFNWENQEQDLLKVYKQFI